MVPNSDQLDTDGDGEGDVCDDDDDGDGKKSINRDGVPGTGIRARVSYSHIPACTVKYRHSSLSLFVTFCLFSQTPSLNL